MTTTFCFSYVGGENYIIKSIPVIKICKVSRTQVSGKPPSENENQNENDLLKMYLINIFDSLDIFCSIRFMLTLSVKMYKSHR